MQALDARLLNLQASHFAAFFLTYLGVAIAASLASLSFVEEPLRSVIRRYFASGSRRPVLG